MAEHLRPPAPKPLLLHCIGLAIRAATFECSTCGHEVTVNNESNRVTDPTVCSECNKKWSFVLQHNHGIYTDKQLVKMQASGQGRGGVLVCKAHWRQDAGQRASERSREGGRGWMWWWWVWAKAARTARLVRLKRPNTISAPDQPRP